MQQWLQCRCLFLKPSVEQVSRKLTQKNALEVIYNFICYKFIHSLILSRKSSSYHNCIKTVLFLLVHVLKVQFTAKNLLWAFTTILMLLCKLHCYLHHHPHHDHFPWARVFSSGRAEVGGRRSVEDDYSWEDGHTVRFSVQKFIKWISVLIN